MFKSTRIHNPYVLKIVDLHQVWVLWMVICMVMVMVMQYKDQPSWPKLTLGLVIYEGGKVRHSIVFHHKWYHGGQAETIALFVFDPRHGRYFDILKSLIAGGCISLLSSSCV